MRKSERRVLLLPLANVEKAKFPSAWTIIRNQSRNKLTDRYSVARTIYQGETAGEKGEGDQAEGKEGWPRERNSERGKREGSVAAGDVKHKPWILSAAC